MKTVYPDQPAKDFNEWIAYIMEQIKKYALALVLLALLTSCSFSYNYERECDHPNRKYNQTKTTPTRAMWSLSGSH